MIFSSSQWWGLFLYPHYSNKNKEESTLTHFAKNGADSQPVGERKYKVKISHLISIYLFIIFFEIWSSKFVTSMLPIFLLSKPSLWHHSHNSYHITHLSFQTPNFISCVPKALLFCRALAPFSPLRSPFHRLYGVQSMVWLSYRILRHTCQRPFIRLRCTAHFRYSVTLPERGMAHTRSRHTITLHFHCFLYLCHRIHIMYPFRTIAFTSWGCMAHLPQFILFVLVAAMWVHLVRTATFVPHITPVRTICTAATKIFFLLLPPLVVCFLWHGQAQGCITWLPVFVPHC